MQDPMAYLDTDTPECKEVRDMLFKQMQKYEDKEGSRP